MGSRKVAEELGQAIQPSFYQIHFLPAQDGCRLPQGLAILYNPDRVLLQRYESGLHQANAPQRPYWVAGLFKVQDGEGGVFWFVVNHWKSNFGMDLSESESKRIDAAKMFADHHRSSGKLFSDAVIMAGDFNCEPWELPFRSPGTFFKAVRERGLVTRPGNDSVYFHNLMWRWLGEPDDLESSHTDGYVSPRPRGTFRSDALKRDMNWKVWDHFLVSKSVLSRTGLIRLQESKLHTVFPGDGCTDHGAISVKVSV